MIPGLSEEGTRGALCLLLPQLQSSWVKGRLSPSPRKVCESVLTTGPMLN